MLKGERGKILLIWAQCAIEGRAGRRKNHYQHKLTTKVKEEKRENVLDDTLLWTFCFEICEPEKDIDKISVASNFYVYTDGDMFMHNITKVC